MSDETGTLSASPSTTINSRHPRRIKLNEQQLESISHEDLLRNWRELDSYVEMLESQTSNQEGSLCSHCCTLLQVELNTCGNKKM